MRFTDSEKKTLEQVIELLDGAKHDVLANKVQAILDPPKAVMDQVMLAMGVASPVVTSVETKVAVAPKVRVVRDAATEGGGRGKPAVDVDQDLVKKILGEVEAGGPLKNKTVLWHEVANRYKAQGGRDHEKITYTVVRLRVESWGWEIKTRSGGRG